MGEKERSTLPKVKVSIHTPPYLALENINLCHHVLKGFLCFCKYTHSDNILKF